jgi:hypothetical protein
MDGSGTNKKGHTKRATLLSTNNFLRGLTLAGRQAYNTRVILETA